MNVDNVKSQMRKGMLEYCIMLLLHKEPAYASDIIQKLKEAQLIVVEGTLYPLLTRLKNDDLLSYEWVESTQGPPRKYYKLTEKGEAFLGELEISWKELNEKMCIRDRIMFDHNNGITFVHQLIKYPHQYTDILKVKSGSRFIENVKRFARISF